jgi:hypothetical protein
VASLIGLGLTAGAVSAGWLYANLGPLGYLPMAGVTIVGLGLVQLARRLEATLPAPLAKEDLV